VADAFRVVACIHVNKYGTLHVDNLYSPSSLLRISPVLAMVLLTTTEVAKAAIHGYLASHADHQKDDSLGQRLERLEKVSLDGPVEHADLIAISKSAGKDKNSTKTRQCRLDTLLRGATVYQPPPPPKPEPVSEMEVAHANAVLDTNHVHHSLPNIKH